MLIYDRLKVIGSLSNLRQKSIRKAIKYYFIKLWIDENGMNKSDYQADITTNIKDYTRRWFINPPVNFKNDLNTILTQLSQYKTLGNSKSFQKFLSYQLDKAYLFKNIPYLQFDNAFGNNISNLVNEIHAEFVGSNPGNIMQALEKNLDIIIGTVSSTDVLFVLADILVKDTYLSELRRVSNSQDLNTIPTLNTLNEYDIILKNIVTNFISPLGTYKSKLDQYNGLFTFINETNVEERNIKIFNFISNLFFGMSVRYPDSKFNFSSNLEKDLTYYVTDVLVNKSYDTAKEQYITYNKYALFFGKFKNELVNEILFQNVNIGQESATSLSSIFVLQRINEIYQRYNANFSNNPEHFNNALQNMKNIYLDIQVLRRARFGTHFIEPKLEEYFNEFCTYKIWHEWLITQSINRSGITEDIYGLIPLEKSMEDFLKPYMLSLLNTNLFEQSEDDLNPTIVNETFVKPNHSIKEQILDTQKLTIAQNIQSRIDIFKYARFTLNGLIDYNEYKLVFYKHVMKLYERLNQNLINKLADELSKFYESI